MTITLSGFSLGLGVVHLLAGVMLLAVPAVVRAGLVRFPRHVWMGRLLAAVALGWSAVLVGEMPLGWFDAYKGWLWVGVPLIYLLVILLMDELLAARALGGLWLLLPAPLLEVARFHPSAWRLLPVVLAYVWVLMGMALVLAPYRFRKWGAVFYSTDGRCRGLGAALLGLGGLFLGLAVTEFSR